MNPRALAGVLVGISLATSGCGGTPELDKELDTVHSWTATVDLAIDQRRSRAISGVFAAQIHEQANDALKQSHATLAKAVRTDDDRRRARASTDSLAFALRSLAQLKLTR
jgi:hypothetical protein